MIAFLVYLVMKLDEFREFIYIVAVIFFTLFMIAGCFYFVDKLIEYSGAEACIENKSGLRKYVRKFGLISAFLYFLYAILPSSKQALVMIAAQALWSYREEIFEFVSKYLP